MGTGVGIEKLPAFYPCSHDQPLQDSMRLIKVRFMAFLPLAEFQKPDENEVAGFNHREGQIHRSLLRLECQD